MKPFVVNGRFLRATGQAASGVQRVGRELIDAARAAGLPFEVLAPRPTNDPRVDRQLAALPGPWGERAWEQLMLPLAAKGRLIVGLANTGPLLFGKSVVMIHDLAPMYEGATLSAAGMRHGRMLLGSAKRARAVLTVSESIKKELIEYGIDADRVFVIRPAVDETFSPSPHDVVAEVLERHHITQPYVLNVGWSVPRKDSATLIAAHRAVVSSSPHQLVLTGARHAMFKAVDVPTDPSIRVLGYVSEQDLRALMTGTAALAYPSRYEGFGLPPLEAMACGSPAIVSDIPVLHESTQDKATFVRLGDTESWARALTEAVEGRLPSPQRIAWTWSDAVEQLRTALESL